MGRPLISAALLLCFLLAAGSAGAQVERDTGSRARAGDTGVSRDVFSRGSARSAEPEAPAAEFQVSPFLEVAAISISYSIKGSAREIAEIVSVSEPEQAGAEELSAAIRLAELPVDEAGSLPVTEPEAGRPDVDEDVRAAVDRANQGVADVAGELGRAAHHDPAAEPESPAIGLHSFGEFPESDSGTLHAPDDAEDNASADTRPAEPEPQVDQPEFLKEGEQPEELPDRLLSADGKHVLAFGDESGGFALPDAMLAPGLEPPGVAGPGAHAGMPVPDWASIKIPSSVTELSRGNRKARRVALTFDDGPHAEYTGELLSILDYYGVPATFFFVGIQCVKYPQLVQQAYESGNEIGSQTYDHFRMPNLPRDEKEYQIDEYQLLIKRLCGTEPRFLRPPGGQIDDQTKALLRERGIVLALWDVALNDTRDGKTAEEMLATAKARVRPGSVILAHDGVGATVELLPELIEELLRQGYEFVTMSELAAGL